MLNIHHLIAVADRYAELTGVEEKTVSSRVFSDSKKLTALKAGADITTARFNQAFAWFSANWPEGAEWPHEVARPLTLEQFDETFPGHAPEAAE